MKVGVGGRRGPGVIILFGLLVAGFLLAISLDDIKRYLKIRSM